MNGIVKLDLCSKHQQEKNHSQFDPHDCDFCKLQKEWEGVRAELLELQGLATCKTVEDQSKPVEPTLETQFDQTPRDKSLPEILEMIRQGVSAEDLVKLKNCGVI